MDASIATRRRQMNFLKEAQIEALIENSRLSCAKEDKIPAAHIVVEGMGFKYEWLLSEIDEDNPNHAFGLISLGTGKLEYGDIDINSIIELGYRNKLSNSIGFTASHTLAVFKAVAEEFGGIVDDDIALEKSFYKASFKLYGE